MKVSFSGKDIDIPVKSVRGFSKGIGLMFRSSKTDNLLFDFSRENKMAITSLFVFFPFLAIWLDEKNRVLGWKIVRPFTFSISPPGKFKRLIEVPINVGNSKILGFFVGEEKFKYRN